MLTDTDDDFFFEEDKIPTNSQAMEDNTPILPIEALSFDIMPICAAYSSSTPQTEEESLISLQTEDLLGIETIKTSKCPEATTQQLATADLLGLEQTNVFENVVKPIAVAATATSADNIAEETTPLDEMPIGDLVDDDLLSSDVTATVVYTAASFETEKFNDFDKQKYEIERLGMTITTKSVVIVKDDTNLIGISIGGGAPLCPCLYIVQVFDGTPASRDGSLESGDELLAINSVSVKGKTKVQVAKMIQAASQQVTIHYNKLHADPERGKSLDIILKKLKHRFVDNMSSNTADTLGLSRAILCNDSLVKRLEELEGTEIMYKGLVEHARRMLKAYYDIFETYRAFGDCFMRISTREPQQRASEAFRIFGEFHRNLEKDGLEIVKNIRPILDDMGTYLHKAIPDTKLTVKRYMDAKFTYLSYCLKVKEMDDEEHGFAAIQEPLYRVETGNYEYRLILRCRQDARAKFARLRTDVLEKMELLESKHTNDLTRQLRSLLENLMKLSSAIAGRMEALPHLFPIEVDFKETDFQYKSKILEPQKLDEDEEEENGKHRTAALSDVACALEAIEEPAPIFNVPAAKVQEQDILLLSDNPSDSLLSLTNITCNSSNINSASKTATKSSPINTTITTKLSCESANKCDQLLKDFGLLGLDFNSSGAASGNTQMPTTSKSHTSSNGSYSFDLFLNQKSSAAVTQLEKDLMACNAMETDLLLQ